MELIIENNEVKSYRYIENPTIPYGVTSIDDWAFEDCEGLINIIIPDTVTNIGEYAFIDCCSLEYVEIPNSVTTIGDYAFIGCIKLIVKCYKNSYAERYCIENDIDYEVIDNMRSEELTLEKYKETTDLIVDSAVENFQKATGLMFKYYYENVLLKKELQNILDDDKFMELEQKIAKAVKERMKKNDIQRID